MSKYYEQNYVRGFLIIYRLLLLQFSLSLRLASLEFRSWNILGTIVGGSMEPERLQIEKNYEKCALKMVSELPLLSIICVVWIKTWRGRSLVADKSSSLYSVLLWNGECSCTFESQRAHKSLSHLSRSSLKHEAHTLKSGHSLSSRESQNICRFLSQAWWTFFISSFQFCLTGIFSELLVSSSKAVLSRFDAWLLIIFISSRKPLEPAILIVCISYN